LRILDDRRHLEVILLLTTLSFSVGAQPRSEKEATYSVSGTGIFGGYGLFTLPTADILPKGRFAAGTAYETGSPNRFAGMKYSLGFGLSSLTEAFVTVSSAPGKTKNEMNQIGLKFNVIRGDLREDLLGSVELGYVQSDRDVNGVGESRYTLLGRLQGGVLLGDLEVAGNLGYAFQPGASSPTNRILAGVGAFVPVIRSITVGAEISSNYSASSTDDFGFSTGIKAHIFDHFQIMVVGRAVLNGSRLTPTFMVGLSFSSAFYRIAPERKQSFSRVPPLPTLEELEKETH